MQYQNETPLLRVDDLRVSFKGENKQWIETVKGISFSIPKVFAESAEEMAISANCSGLGFGTIAQSP